MFLKSIVPVLLGIVFVVAYGILSNALQYQNDWVKTAFFVMGLYFCGYCYKNTKFKEDSKIKIAKLEQEIRQLKSTIETKKQFIELLEKELDKISK